MDGGIDRSRNVASGSEIGIQSPDPIRQNMLYNFHSDDSPYKD